MDKSVVRLAGGQSLLRVGLHGAVQSRWGGGNEWGVGGHRMYLAPKPGLPLHVNTREDQAFYSWKGRLLSDWVSALSRPGRGARLVPRGSVHTFRNLGEETARFLCVVAPAGLETCFGDVLELTNEAAAWPSVITRLLALYRKYGLEIKGPPLGT